MIRNERHALIIVGTSYKFAPAGGANNSISQDINKIKLPKAIKQGTGIPLKSFYKLYGDGENTFKGITK